MASQHAMGVNVYSVTWFVRVSVDVVHASLLCPVLVRIIVIISSVCYADLNPYQSILLD